MTDSTNAPGAQGGESGGEGNREQQTQQPGDQQQQQTPPEQQQQQQQQQGDDPWSDPDKARREIERLRRENGDARINAKQAAAEEARQQLLAEITKALDPNAGDKPPTIESVTEQLTAVTTERDSLASERDDAKREAALIREAWKQQVDPSKFDYLAFKLSKSSDFGALTGAEDDFAGKLSAVISNEIAQDSSLKLAGPARSTSVDQHGGAGGTSTITKAEFDRMSYAQRVDLYNTNRAEYDRLASS